MTFLTPGYAPAEQYSPNGIQGPWTDIYSLAATLYFSLTGVLPPTPTDRMFGDDPLVPPSQLGVDISEHDESWLLKGLAVRWSHRPDSVQAWKSLIYDSKLVIAKDASAQSKIAEDNFVKIAVLPKLANKKLYPKDEQEIYASAAFMEIPKERVHNLIETAMIKTDAVRNEVDEEDVKAQELQKREEELRRKEEELKHFEILRQKEEDLKHKEAAFNAKLNQSGETVTEAKKTKPSDPFDPEETKDDISDEEVSELLKLFASPHKQDPQKAEKTAEKPKEISLDQHYAQLASDMTPLPKSQSRLIPAGIVSLPERITNSLGMEFRLIYPSLSGENFVVFRDFSVGPPELGFAILSTRPFYLQTTPVTQMQWQMPMNINPSQFEPYSLLPVDQVSWDDCQLFIHRLNQFQEARYRLPAEVEWEFACRAGSTQTYFFGDDGSALTQYAWFKTNASQQIQAVGLKRPNPFGLFDMLGNVQEWMQDRFIALDAIEVKGNQRTLRGGAWNADAQDCSSASRSSAQAN